MKYLIILMILVFTSFTVQAEDKKLYTEAEFQKKLKEELLKQVTKIKKTSVADLTKELIEKDSLLKKREDELAMKEDLLEANKKALKRQIVGFEDKQKKILGCASENKAKVSQRLSKMVEVISNMKPAKASAILSIQDSEISVKILSMIDPVKASKIFNLMEKEKSARLQKEYLNMKK